MRLYVCQVRRIVSEYDNSVDTVAAYYDSDPETRRLLGLRTTILETEEEHREIAVDLYDAYARAVSSALINAPVLFNVGFNGHEHVLHVPSHVNRDDLMLWREQDRFFLSGLDNLVIPALSEALATM